MNLYLVKTDTMASAEVEKGCENYIGSLVAVIGPGMHAVS